MSLASRLSVKQVAWNFGGSTRVFKVPELLVRAKQEIQTYETANGSYGIDYLGIWLTFEVSTQFFKEQISGTACDRIDILNALKGTSTVNFYPDYENQSSILYAVKSADSNVTLLRTRRGLFSPAQTIKMKAVVRVDDYPAWLKYK